MPEEDATTRTEEGDASKASPARAIDDPTQPSPEDERVEAMLSHTIDVSALASAVALQYAADAADTLEQLDDEEAVELLEEMDDGAAAEALAEMQTPLAATVIADLAAEDDQYAVRLLGLMAPDDAADLLQAIDHGTRERMLGAMPHEYAVDLRRLVGYDEDSAGGLMTTEFVGLGSDMTVAEAIEAIRGRDLPDDFQTLPVLAEGDRLVGLVGLRDLLLSAADTPIRDLVVESVPAVNVAMDREEVALAFDRYDHAMLPVVDDDERLLGVVTVDDVIDAIRLEQTEDVQMTVGAGAGEAVFSGFGEKFRGRFPWLGFSLLMTSFAAAVILIFHDLVRERPVIAFIMPVIAAIVGNAGHQALAVTLRGIVLGEVRKGLVRPLLVREMGVGLLTGALLGLAMAAIVGVVGTLAKDAEAFKLGSIAGISMALAMMVGTLSGASVPLLMRRVGFDPAHASAILLIMVTDAVSFGILLGLAFVIM